MGRHFQQHVRLDSRDTLRNWDAHVKNVDIDLWNSGIAWFGKYTYHEPNPQLKDRKPVFVPPRPLKVPKKGACHTLANLI
eukprot:893141-Pelagomonas_calceolata.AAC.11